MKLAHTLAFPIAIFLSALIFPSAHAQAQDQVEALLAMKATVGSTSADLSSWKASSSGGPCEDKWVGVTCDSSKQIIGLNMSNCGLKGAFRKHAFSALRSLKSLDFSSNHLENPFPSLDDLKALHDLNFSHNYFQGAFPPTVLSLTNLVKLHLDENNLTEAIPEGISNLKLLEEIWLGGTNRFTGPLPKGLASLPNMKILSVWAADLQQTLPPEWAIWVNLTYLNLHSTQLKGKLPPEWGQSFTKLQRLHLYDNKLTGSIPESWKGMTSLTEFRFKNNYLSGPVPSQILQVLQKNNATVDFVCNYLTGPYPRVFNENTWMGNCFDSSHRAHELKCDVDGTCEEGPPGVSEHTKSSFTIGAIIAIVVAVVVLLLSILFVSYRFARSDEYSRRRRRRRDKDAGDWEVPQGVRRFTYKEILKATKSFNKSCEIGQGGFGKVYVAQLEHGKHFAIKRATDMSFQGTKEFQNEITLLSRLHHCHLVQLEGFCDDKDEQILVYEYMSNGNLHCQLFDKHAVNLNWYRRLEIALSVAQGLEYLHSFADPPIIHRDIKPSNILLDDHMTAKVSDFGISKANLDMDTHLSTRPAGTAGYLDPEYFLRRQLTAASDVYGYGVVLLEIITGQLAIDHKRLEDYNLVGWVKPRLVRKGIHAIIDPRLGPNFPVEAYEEIAGIAVGCTAFERGDRPTMQTVASKLEHILSGLIPPPEYIMPLSPLILSSQISSPLILSSQISTGSGTRGLQDAMVEPR